MAKSAAVTISAREASAMVWERSRTSAVGGEEGDYRENTIGIGCVVGKCDVGVPQDLRIGQEGAEIV